MQAIRVRKGNIFTLLVGMQTGIAIIEVSQKVKIELMWCSNPNSGYIYPKNKTQLENAPMFIASLFIITRYESNLIESNIKHPQQMNG